MSISYQSKDSAILDQQLKVQELVIRFADVGLYSQAGAVTTVDLKEVCTIVSVVNHDNSALVTVLNAAASNVVTGTSVAITLLAAFAASDVLVIKYIVTE